MRRCEVCNSWLGQRDKLKIRETLIKAALLIVIGLIVLVALLAGVLAVLGSRLPEAHSASGRSSCIKLQQRFIKWFAILARQRDGEGT